MQNIELHSICFYLLSFIKLGTELKLWNASSTKSLILSSSSSMISSSKQTEDSNELKWDEADKRTTGASQFTTACISNHMPSQIWDESTIHSQTSMKINIGPGNGLVLWHQAIIWTDVDPNLCCHMMSTYRYHPTSVRILITKIGWSHNQLIIKTLCVKRWSLYWNMNQDASISPRDPMQEQISWSPNGPSAQQ